MIGNTNIMLTQEGQECYNNEAEVDAMQILYKDNDFINTAAEFDETITEKSQSMACSKRARGMTYHVIGTAGERKVE